MKRLRESRLTKGLYLLLCAGLILGGAPVSWSQIVQPQTVQTGAEEKLVSLSFRDAPISVVLDHYAEITGRTMIQSPGIPAVLVTLRGQQKLTETEFLVAIESVLAMNNITLVPMGEKFLKVIPSGELGTHGRQIKKDVSVDGPLPDPGTDTMESRIFELKNLEIGEIQPIIEGLKHSYGRITPLERTNALLITDTAASLKQITEIIEYLDGPIERKVETRIYELVHAEAAQIASRLNELVQESEQAQATRSQTQRTTTRTVRGVIRPGQTAAAQQQQQQASTPTGESEAELAARGIVLPPVKIVSDERTNILIVITRPENFAFFDKIVTILDKSIEPNFTLEVVALEFADAQEIAGILNDFVGAATADAQSRQGQGAADTAGDAEERVGQSTALQDLVRRRLAQRDALARSTSRDQQAEQISDDIGQLSANTRILSDQRTNSILLMGRKQDIEALKRVVDGLDVMLAQVLIEAVILEVNLNDNVEYGIDWLQRSFTVYNDEKIGPGGGLTVSDPVLAFGGSQRLRGGPFPDASQIAREDADDLFSIGGLTYYATFFDLNLDAVIRLAGGSSDARILSTPVVVTTDNTEARILVGESRPVVTSTSTTAGGVARNTFQYQEIGISLNVTPRINPQNFVVMEITQTADNVGGFEVIDGNNVPIITRRELQAQIAVEDKATIVLGGLVSSDGQKSTTKVPILGDIPILGHLFRSESKLKNRTELLVLITPYVMSSPRDVAKESRRLRDRSFADSSTWEGTWSDSNLLQPGRAGEDGASGRTLMDDKDRSRVGDLLVRDPEDDRAPRGILGPKTMEVDGSALSPVPAPGLDDPVPMLGPVTVEEVMPEPPRDDSDWMALPGQDAIPGQDAMPESAPYPALPVPSPLIEEEPMTLDEPWYPAPEYELAPAEVEPAEIEPAEPEPIEPEPLLPAAPRLPPIPALPPVIVPTPVPSGPVEPRPEEPEERAVPPLAGVVEPAGGEPITVAPAAMPATDVIQVEPLSAPVEPVEVRPDAPQSSLNTDEVDVQAAGKVDTIAVVPASWFDVADARSDEDSEWKRIPTQRVTDSAAPVQNASPPPVTVVAPPPMPAPAESLEEDAAPSVDMEPTALGEKPEADPGAMPQGMSEASADVSEPVGLWRRLRKERPVEPAPMKPAETVTTPEPSEEQPMAAKPAIPKPEALPVRKVKRTSWTALPSRQEDHAPTRPEIVEPKAEEPLAPGGSPDQSARASGASAKTASYPPKRPPDVEPEPPVTVPRLIRRTVQPAQVVEQGGREDKAEAIPDASPVETETGRLANELRSVLSDTEADELDEREPPEAMRPAQAEEGATQEAPAEQRIVRELPAPPPRVDSAPPASGRAEDDVAAPPPLR